MLLSPGKITLFASYLFIGFYLAFLFPWKNKGVLFNAKLLTTSGSINQPAKIIYWLAGILGLAALTLIPWWYVAISIAISLIISWLNKSDLTYRGSCIFIGLIFASFLPWWLHNSKNRLQISLSETLIFLIITSTAYLLFANAYKLQTPNSTTAVKKLVDLIFFAVLCMVYAMSITVSISTADFAQWHHWGAYLGPAELIFNGVYPLYDIPMQYGLGPSLAIASGCQWGCWNSLFWVITITNLIFALTLAAIAVRLYEPRNWLERSLVLLVVLVLCLFWLSHPISLQAPNAFPSGNGLRFLPGLLMLAILILDNRQLSSNVNTFKVLSLSKVPALTLWILSFAWSPEAGIHTTCLIAPYYFWRLLSQVNNKQYLSSAVFCICQLVGIFIIGILMMATIYYFFLGEWPSLSLYLTYILNPINPSPVNPNGPIWIILLITFMLWSWGKNALAHAIKPSSPQSLLSNTWLVALLCFANFSYCLGRSSDGNLIAMLPYFLLLVLVIQRWSEAGANKILSSVLLASIIGWAAIPTHINNYKLAFTQDHLMTFDANRLVNAFDRGSPQSRFYIKFDKPVEREKLISVQSAITALRSQFNEPIETFDRYSLIDAKDPNPPWNALYGPANFTEIPSPLRQLYLHRVAKRLGAAGWVLFDKEYREMDQYLRDYDAAYERTQTIDFGYYTAIRFSPR